MAHVNGTAKWVAIVLTAVVMLGTAGVGYGVLMADVRHNTEAAKDQEKKIDAVEDRLRRIENSQSRTEEAVKAILNEIRRR